MVSVVPLNRENQGAQFAELPPNAGSVTAEIQGIFSCPSTSFAADPLCCTLLIWQQLNLIQLEVHGKQISKFMGTSLCESSLSIPEEE